MTWRTARWIRFPAGSANECGFPWSWPSKPDILFLDEPTTYLDLSHSIEVLELVHRLSREHGRTIVMVLHDLNLALRYSDNLVVMRDGNLKAVGKPRDVISPELLKQVFDLDAVVVECPVTGGPLIVPALISAARFLTRSRCRRPWRCTVFCGVHSCFTAVFLLIGHNQGCEHASHGFRIFHALVARAHNIAHDLVALARCRIHHGAFHREHPQTVTVAAFRFGAVVTGAHHYPHRSGPRLGQCLPGFRV